MVLNLAKDTASDPLVVELRDVGGDGAPGGTVLAQTYLGAERVSATAAWLPLGLSAPVTAGTAYAIVAYAAGGSVYQWNGAKTDTYSGGQGYYQYASPPAAAWATSAGDRAFGTYLAATGAVAGFTDPGCTTWTAPPGVRSVRALVTGAAGATTSTSAGVLLPPTIVPGGLGDTMTATIADLAPAQELSRVRVNVGSAGSSGAGRPGGGASGVSLGSDFSSPVVVGAGGGAASSQSAFGAARGGNAGWPAGVDGEGSQPGRGGTQSVAGGGGEPGSATTAAGPGGGGAGTAVYSGGGGGGWFGGGGGSDLSSIVVIGSGGGGGSDSAPPSRRSAAGPRRFGSRCVTLTYTWPRPRSRRRSPGRQRAVRRRP